jgi:DNA primase small subunit
MTAEARRAIVGYLEVVKGGEGQTRRVNIAPNRGLVPTLQAAYKELQAWFEVIVVEQELMGEKESWDKILALVPDEGIIDLMLIYGRNSTKVRYSLDAERRST